MSNVLKELEGFSGSSIFLIQETDRVFVRKINNIERNFERLTFLESQGFPVPKIYSKTDNQLDLEYIHGLDIKNYLKTRSPDHLIKFIQEIYMKKIFLFTG